MRRRAAFTILELLVCVGLSTLLMGVIVVAFRSTLDVRDHALDRLDRERTTAAVGARLATDALTALAPPDLPRFFSITCSVQPAHLDALELTVLEPDGLARVRYAVAWDVASQTGFLWRERTPVLAGELPSVMRPLASRAAPETTLLLSDVTRFQVRVPDAAGVPLDPPGGLLDGDVALSWAGRALVVHDRLTIPPGAPPAALRPGSLVWLRDDAVGRSGIDAGFYPILRCETGVATLAHRAGSCDQAAARTRWLPARLIVDLVAGGQVQALDLRLQRAAQAPSLLAQARLRPAAPDPPAGANRP